MFKYIPLIFITLQSITTLSQELTKYRSAYPEGIYATKQDFIKKTPSSNEKIYPVKVESWTSIGPDSIPDRCQFYFDKSDKKLKKAFAIVHNGFLFFKKNEMLVPRNRNKKDDDQVSNNLKSYCRVLIGGENYLYTEVELQSGWATAAAGQGGIIGAIAAGDLSRFKGIVWDYKNHEFNIFRNCKDYNRFIENLHKEGVQECNSKRYDILKIRESMIVIK